MKAKKISCNLREKQYRGKYMNTFGEWYNPFTWFDGSATTDSTSTSTDSQNLFGFPDWLTGATGTDIQTGASDSTLADWNTYWANGGVMGADLSGSGSAGGSSFDFLGGVNDFLAGLTGVAQTGLGIWQGVQTIINQTNPSDELVKLPGSNTPVVKRTTGGQTQYFPITQLYPSLSSQVKTAENSWIGPALLAGVLGVGLILILKKK
jgi:hypothetical protein